MRDTPEGKLRPRAGDVLGHAGAAPRSPQGDDRGGAGRVLRRRSHARVDVRPDRGGRRRALLQPGLCACRASASSCSSSRGSSDRGRRRSSCSSARRSTAAEAERSASSTASFPTPISHARPAHGRAGRARAADDRRGDQALDQRHARPQGQRDSWQLPLLAPPVRVEHADGARPRPRHAQTGGMDAVKRASRRVGPAGHNMTGPLDGSAGPRPRHPHRRAVLRRAARRAGCRRRQDRTARAPATSCARSDRSRRRPTRRRRLLAVLGGRGTRSAERDARPAPPEGQDLFRRLAAKCRRASSRTSGPERSRSGTSRPTASTRRLVDRAHLQLRPGRPLRAAAGPRPRRHRRTADSSISPATPIGRRSAWASRSSDYLTGVFAAHAATSRAVPARHSRRRRRRDRRRALRLGRCAFSSGRSRPTTGSASYATVKATAWPTPRPSTTTQRPMASTCASSRAPTRTSLGCARRWTDAELVDDPRFGKLADRAAHSDEINGIVAQWTSNCLPTRSSGDASSTTCR